MNFLMRISQRWFVLALALSLLSRLALADDPQELFGNDDVLDAQVQTSVHYHPSLSAPQWIVPGPGLPAEVKLLPSNNNDAIAFFHGRLYLAWRSAPTHFASKLTKMFLVSSEWRADGGWDWRFEREIAVGRDVREPYFLVFEDQLIFSYFEAGSNVLSFDPHRLMRMRLGADGRWSEAEEWGAPGEIAWELKSRGGVAWATTYRGNHYKAGRSDVEVYFKRSTDGLNWETLNTIYTGGVSEVGFEFDRAGDAWGVMRNEDGDESGFGSHVAVARAGHYGQWEIPALSNPHRYDSPRMFRHGEELYLVARREIGPAYGYLCGWLPLGLRKFCALADYSFHSKRSALYRIDRDRREVEWLMDLPSAGDTAFASILRVSPHRFLIANYSSPFDKVDWTWIQGQDSRAGTGVYFTTLEFEPDPR